MTKTTSGPAVGDWSKRRRYPRVGVDLDIRVVMSAEKGSTVVPARLSVLGAGGGFLETPQAFEVGSNVTLHFMLPSTPPADILCTAQVRYAIDGKGLGLQFLDLMPDQRESIAGFVRLWASIAEMKSSPEV